MLPYQKSLAPYFMAKMGEIGEEIKGLKHTSE